MNVRRILGLAVCVLTVGTTACGGGEADSPAPAYDVETARADVLAAEMGMNEAVDGLDCAAGVSFMGEADPIFVSSGDVVRTRSALAEICEQMVAPRSGAVFSIESRAAHVLSEDAAFGVRGGLPGHDLDLGAGAGGVEDDPSPRIGTLPGGRRRAFAGGWLTEAGRRSFRAGVTRRQGGHVLGLVARR